MNYAEYLCNPAPEFPESLLEISRFYYATAEAYDRTVCTGPVKHGSIYPANNHEIVLINRFAAGLLKQCRAYAKQLGYSPEQLKAAMQTCGK